jgi:molecular chaperone GrpE
MSESDKNALELGEEDTDEDAPSGERRMGEEPPPEGAAGDGAGAEPEPALEEQLEAARAEIAASRERMLRVAADFDNYRKRAARDTEDARRRATQAAVRELLPVFDNLERATSHAESAPDVQSLIEGLNMVQKLFVDSLAKLGIERVPTVGHPFDPALHDGIQHDYSDEHPAGTAMKELLAGYRMGSELIRPALVVVSRGAEPGDGAPSGNGAPDDDSENGAPKS